MGAVLENFEKINVDGGVVITAHLIYPSLLEAKEFEKIINEQISFGHSRLVVDLSMCEHIDSTFMGVIIKSFKKLNYIGGALRIVKPVKVKEDIFILTKTLKVFDLYTKREDAVRSLERFQKINVGDVSVIAVNLSRSTLNEAAAFKKVVEDEINSGHTNLVIDLTRCEIIDSTFYGVIIMALRMTKDKGYKLKVVEPANPGEDIFTITNTLRLFEKYKTREEAIKSFE